MPSPNQALGSPLAVIKALYSQAQTPEQRQACLRYLLHYQQYNANYDAETRTHLNYPAPLCAPQDRSGYFRTEYHQQAELIAPWCRTNLRPLFEKLFSNFIPKSKFETYLKITNKQAITIITSLASSDGQWREPCHFPTSKLTSEARLIIRLSMTDLREKYTGLQLIKAKLNERKPAQLTLNLTVGKTTPVLFILEEPGIDCTLLWTGLLSRSKKGYQLRLEAPTKSLGKDIFSTLSQAGAVPDRLALNQWITRSLGQSEQNWQQDLVAIGISDNAINFSLDPQSDDQTWRQHLADYPLDPFYFEAILHWQAIFFEPHEEAQSLAGALLCSEVLPWLHSKADLVQISKAYQNLCEIILLCLDYYPELYPDLNFEHAFLEQLLQTHRLKTVQKSAKLYPYAMSAYFDILNMAIAQVDHPPKVACICHNYFESLELTKQFEAQKTISLSRVDCVQDIKIWPDILIADFHPNNAAKDTTLFQNDIVNWVCGELDGNDKRLILILDFTLNHPRDPIMQSMLERLSSFISSQRLNVYGLQSQAKLVQLGADTCSGGAYFYLGSVQAPDTAYQRPVPAKEKFMALLTTQFSDLSAQYFKKIRHNTDLVYHGLLKKLDTVERDVTIAEASFCATNITYNTDEGTVYISIGFKPFLDKASYVLDQLPRRGNPGDVVLIENLTTFFRGIILQLAEIRNLPFTHRQSFGFTLSNMSITAHRLRFSIGIESEPILSLYLSLLHDFSYALSKFLANNPEGFELENFKQKIISIYCLIYNQGKQTPLVTIPILKEECNEYGGECLVKIGMADLYYSKGTLRLTQPGATTKIISEPHLGFYHNSFWSRPEAGYSYKKLFQLLFHCTRFNSGNLFLFKEANAYSLGGFLPSRYLFDTDSPTMSGSNAFVKLPPGFTVCTDDDERFNAQKVFVVVEEIGSEPVRLSKLPPDENYEVMLKFKQRYWHVIENHSHPNTIRIVFSDRIPYYNYKKEIFKRDSVSGYAGVVAFINNLDIENLQLCHNQGYYGKRATTAKARLIYLLRRYGIDIAPHITPNSIASLAGICEPIFKKAALSGIIDGLMKQALTRQKHPPKISVIHEMLKTYYFQPPDESRSLINYMAIETWIKDLEHKLNNTELHKNITLYLDALFPLLQAHIQTPTDLLDSTCRNELYIISQTLSESFPQLALKQHLETIEAQIPELLMRGKVRTLTFCLAFFTQLPIEEKTKLKIIENINRYDSKTLTAWLKKQPDLYTYPLDELEIRIADLGLPHSAEVVLNLGLPETKSAFTRFFTESKCKVTLQNALLQQLKKLFLPALIWAIRLNDPDIFKLLSELLEHVPSNRLRSAEYYLPNLTRDDSAQRAIAEAIETTLSPREGGRDAGADALAKRQPITASEAPIASDGVPPQSAPGTWGHHPTRRPDIAPLPSLTFTTNSMIDIEPLVRYLQNLTELPVRHLTRRALADWLRTPDDQTTLPGLIAQTIGELEPGQTLLVPINIQNAHYTLLAFRCSAANQLQATYVDSFGDYEKTLPIIQEYCHALGIPLSALTEIYQHNNDCAVQVALNARILLTLPDADFNQVALWERILQAGFNQPDTATAERLRFALAVRDMDLGDIYTDISIAPDLFDHATAPPAAALEEDDKDSAFKALSSGGF